MAINCAYCLYVNNMSDLDAFVISISKESRLPSDITIKAIERRADRIFGRSSKVSNRIFKLYTDKNPLLISEFKPSPCGCVRK